MKLAYRPRSVAPNDPFLRHLYVRTLRQAYMLGILDLSFSEEDVPSALLDALISRTRQVF